MRSALQNSAKGAAARRKSAKRTADLWRSARHCTRLARLFEIKAWAIRFSVIVSLWLGFANAALSQSKAETDRLIAVGKLWATVKYFHPYLAYRDIDWDQALIAALPKIRSASTTAEYSAAVSSMLDALHDPCSFVQTPRTLSSPPKIERQGDGKVVIAGDIGRQELLAAIQSAHSITIDLRNSQSLLDTIDEPEIAEALGGYAVDYPGQRSWFHSGLPSFSGINRNEFYSAFLIKPGHPRSAAPPASDLKITFLLGESARLPAIASALLAAGKASLLGQPQHYSVGDVESVPMPLGDDLNAIVRTSEAVLKDDRSLSPASPPRTDNVYADKLYPSVEKRILAAYKIWAAFRYFFAYRDLIDEDWDDTFAHYLPQIIAAKDAREYNLTVAEFLTKVDDSNVTIRSQVMDEYFGTAAVPLRIGLIEKRPVVLAIFSDEASQAGIKIGDVITEVDGEDMATRIKRIAQYIPASTQQSIRQLVTSRVLNGAPGSSAVLTVRDEEGHSRHVMLKRQVSYIAAMAYQRSSNIVETLAGNIGYIDLDRLQPAQIDSAFERLKDTKAIIFDMRGTPRTDPATIASHLTDKPDAAAAIVTGPLSFRPDVPRPQILTDTASYFFVKAVPRAAGPIYKGKAAMLIDERTSGAAELMALYFEAAGANAFIGQPSAGAYTIATDFVIPGGMTITMSGRDIRHGNAGKLQRVGILPSLQVDVTVNGIRNGRDEILEKALASAAQ